MLELSNLNKENLKDDDYFDIDELPDLDSDTTVEDRFIDIQKEKKVAEKVAEKKFIKLLKDDLKVKDGLYKREGNIIILNFKVGADDINRIAKMSHGILSPTIKDGSYEFEIRKKTDDIEELYFYDEFVGEILDNNPRIYKRYFALAVVKSMVKQDMLYEYERNKFTIHPAFFLKLKLNNNAVAEKLKEKGFPIISEEEINKQKKFRSLENK